MCLGWCPRPLTAGPQPNRTTDQHQQLRPFSKLPARLRFSSAQANTRWSSIYVRLSQLYFNDLNGSLSEAKKLCFVWPSTWQRHKWSAAAGKQGHKASELDWDCAAAQVNARPWITPNWTPRPRFKTQSSMFTLFFFCFFLPFLLVHSLYTGPGGRTFPSE